MQNVIDKKELSKGSFLLYRKDLVALTGESSSCKVKNTPWGGALARNEDVADATVLGARVRKRTLCSCIGKCGHRYVT